MKGQFKHELMLLSLPVVALIGGAWFWARHAGSSSLPLNLSGVLDPGPLRLEHSAFEPAELTPSDISLGYDWARSAHVWRVGTLNLPKGLCEEDGYSFIRSNLQLVYRRGQEWKTAPLIEGDRCLWECHNLVNNDTATLKIDLKNVPRDANEVRLKGRFQVELFLARVVPGKKPVSIGGTPQTVYSKPFDIAIKG